MKFAELYQENCTAVKETLKAMWCSNTKSKTQSKYAEAIGKLIDEELFTSEKYMPLVQCMDRYKSTTHEEEALNIVGDLWEKSIDHKKGDKDYYPPYEHQYESWKALSNSDGPKNSMVVTTGTGSGKTECFMLPLVRDLLDHKNEGKIEAIFLYPLNALMEDQKDRLQTLLEDTHIKFAVYNGNLPESDPGEHVDNQSQRKLHDRIQEEKRKYKNIIPTRSELHTQAKRPNILLTNPTMLEYMLLRKKDQCLFTPGSLKWIVIDETHTFSGAGAAELAMLLRRVLTAFDVKPSDVRFATSSATIGNAQTEDEKKANDEKLRHFISDISGVDNPQIKLITGDRIPSAVSADEEKERCRQLLSNNDYIKLSDLFPDGPISAKLKKLDEMCEGDDAPLKAKLHLFYRVPNNGLRVRLDKFSDGVFDLFSSIPANSDEMPYLELMRCSHCGEYFAAAESVPNTANQYRALTSSSSDLFDFNSTDQSNNKLLFSLTRKDSSQVSDKDGNFLAKIEGNTYEPDSNTYVNGWSVIANVQKCCPHCHALVIGHQDIESSNKNNHKKQEENNELENEINENVVSFRMSAPFISRVLAPSCLQQMRKSDDTSCPHHGQQYISFVDSRQAAARSTMQQNIDQERLWVYSRLFNKLNERKKNANKQSIQKEIKDISKKIAAATDNKDFQTAFELQQQLGVLKDNLNHAIDDYMSWDEVFNYLRNETPECEQLCYQFANKNEVGSELQDNCDSVDDVVKSKYVYSVMLEQLGKRPRKPAAPETLGLFTTYYPKLEQINTLPEEVQDFNAKYLQNSKQIDLKQWKNFLKNFLDYVVRSNESVYLRVNNSNIDIVSCQRFGTTKPPRRPVHKPNVDDDKIAPIYASSIIFLAKLIAPDSDSLRETAYTHREDINAVLDAMWHNLKDDTKLIQQSFLYKNNNWEPDCDNDDNHTPQYRLNVVDIAFKLYENVCLCDTRLRGEQFEVLRPIEYSTLFMGFSPYPIDGVPVSPNKKEEWSPFPYLNGLKDGHPLKKNDVEEWASENRRILWDNGIWGVNGCFSNRLTTVYLYPEIFVQAEHTAQVDKLVSKQSQEKFKEQKINILACSTTMEMGVDLGNLELVFMTSIPPHPSNYKQRAGRSGRNKDTRSACITLCGSDAVGLRTLLSPMEQIIKRPMAVPFVDLKSPQVVQRHVNAFLFRSSRLFFENPRGNANNLDQEIIEFFTPFHFNEEEKGEKPFTVVDEEHKEIYPDSLLGEKDKTRYYEFKKYLEGDDVKLLDNTIINVSGSIDKIGMLLQGTCYDGESTDCISRCKQEIERCYDELWGSVADISESYIEEKERLENSSKDEDRKKVDGPCVKSGYGYYLRHKYTEILSKNIIAYFATNRFTPNANMPVEIIEFNKALKYESGEKFSSYARKSNNPSYTLREAISQYSPGNTIVLENRTIVVRGLLYTGMYKQTATFKKIYSDGITTVIDTPSRIPEDKQKEWPINERKALTLIEPVSFIPDINESESRVVDRNPFTQVSAQLIGANKWNDTNNTSSLFMTRNNLDCGEAKILYYNEGVGYGYAFCRDCGKTVLETHAAQRYANLNGMQNETKKDKNGDLVYFHNKINRKEKNGRPSSCGFLKKIERNVIIGGLLQTDYTEIKIRMAKTLLWVDSKKDVENLLITLGVVITNQFVEYLGKDRNDVDFVVMPNAHLCIFDTNPGGSGYSNQLSSYVVMQEVLKQSKTTLERISSKEELLDKFTVRYLDKLDISAAANWINSALEFLGEIPNEIKQKTNGDVKVAYYESILEYMKNTPDVPRILYVNSQWEKWLYSPENKDVSILGWKQRVQDIRGLNLTPDVCITNCETIPLPIYSILGSIKDWASVKSANNVLPDGLFPIALIGDTLFFTVDESVSCLNQDWARGQLYCTSKKNFASFEYEKVNTEFAYEENHSKNVIFKLSDHRDIDSKNLGSIVAKAFDSLVNEFKSHCISHPNSELNIVYQDEHLKSVIGMVTTLQFIDYFIDMFNNSLFHISFKTEEYYEGRPCYNISNNYENDVDRNEKLYELTDGWLTSKLNKDFNDVKNLRQIETLPDKSLPHWRELRFSCAGKSLVIYPNGGIINEWFLARNRTQRVYRLDDTTVNDSLPLYRKKEIKYDAEVVSE